jgi:hypothetical protein
MIYEYKMQWLCTRNEAISIIRIIGAQSLTQINVINPFNKMKIINRYSKMIEYDEDEATINTIKWIQSTSNQYSKMCVLFELIRRT